MTHGTFGSALLKASERILGPQQRCASIDLLEGMGVQDLSALIQVKRVTPSSTAHKSFPMAPGRKAIGEVKEFKVVSDHLGRGRELVDVSKNKEKERQKGRGRTPEKEGTPL